MVLILTVADVISSCLDHLFKIVSQLVPVFFAIGIGLLITTVKHRLVGSAILFFFCKTHRLYWKTNWPKGNIYPPFHKLLIFYKLLVLLFLFPSPSSECLSSGS